MITGLHLLSRNPSRLFCSGGYCYGFQGQESDNEVKGVGNSYDFGARIYDPRIGRWLSTDPLEAKFAGMSPYVFAANSPLYLVDENGEEPSPAAYKSAAKTLGVSVAHIRAVYTTEVGENAYLPDGRIKILYERHYFSSKTGGKFDETNPDLSNPTSGGYGRYSEQFGKLEQAKMLDKNAAFESISIGGMQIMGSNFKAVGFTSAEEFVTAMINGTEDDHLQAFVNFVKNDKFAPEGKTKQKALQDGDWDSFARNYNGPKYKNNNYGAKMRSNFNKFKDNPLKGLVEKISQEKSAPSKPSVNQVNNPLLPSSTGGSTATK